MFMIRKRTGRMILSTVLAVVMAVAMAPTMTITSHAYTPAVVPMVGDSDVEMLEDLLIDALSVDRSKYTSGSLARLDEAIAAAQLITDDPGSYTIDEVFTAVTALGGALANLAEKVERETLRIVIEAAEAIDAGALIVPVREGLIAALNAAKLVYDDDEATEEDISSAFRTLVLSVTQASFVIGDDSDLLTLVNDIGSVSAADYTAESFYVFSIVLAEVQDILSYPEYYTQSMIDGAYENLTDAYNGLQRIGGGPNDPGQGGGGGPNDPGQGGGGPNDPGQGGGGSPNGAGPIDLQQSGGNDVQTAQTAQTVKAQSVILSGAPANGKFQYKASGKGNTLLLNAKVLPDTATNTSVVWKSSNARIATVDPNGLVTFKGPEGAVVITAESPDGPVVSVPLTSVKNVTSIRTPLSTLYMQKGKSLTLPTVLDDKTAPKTAVASKLTWKSSKPSVLSVTQKGTIKAAKKLKKKTTVTVTVTAANGKSKKIKVVVVPKAKTLKGVTAKFPKKNRMKTGAAYQLKVKLRSAQATNVKVTFKSSNNKVIKVDKAGKLLALKKGKATITIKAGKKVFKKKITVR
jgi:hypothetical protein